MCMVKSVMEIKCQTYSYYNKTNYSPYKSADFIHFKGRGDGSSVLKRVKSCGDLGINADIFEKRPVESADTTGLLHSVKEYVHDYKKNLIHTYEHKIVYAMIEKELFGKISMNSVTHDLDKMILYLLGFPRSFVSKFHRQHSQHHIESGKVMNLPSMLCDNIASSPFFKPDKKYTLRTYYNKSKELQNLEGFKDLFEKYNYGENLNFADINNRKNNKIKSIRGFAKAIFSSLNIFLCSLW